MWPMHMIEAVWCDHYVGKALNALQTRHCISTARYESEVAILCKNYQVERNV